MTTIYHNPRCSKSRATLALLRARGIEPEVVEYLKNPPNAEKLKAVIGMLKVSPQEIVRTGESLYAELDLRNKSLSETEWIDLIVANSQLLERPIVVHGNKAAVGRPPEKVLEIL